MANRRLPIGVADGEPLHWDKLVIEDVEFPGTVDVQVKQSQKKDEKKSKGQNGAEVEYAGADPEKVSIVIQYITDEDHQRFMSKCFPLVRPNPDKEKVTSKKINHAVTEAWKISAIHVDALEGPKRAAAFWEWHIDATAHRAPTSKNATGTFGGAPPKGADCVALKNYRDSLSSQYISLENERAELIRLRTQRGDPAFFEEVGSIGGAVAEANDIEVNNDGAALDERIAVLTGLTIGLKAQMDQTEALMRANKCPQAGTAGRTDP